MAKNEASDRENKLNFTAFLQGRVTSITASFIDDRGKIIKFDGRCPDFFGYERAEFEGQIKNIKQLMPNVVANKHDAIVN